MKNNQLGLFQVNTFLQWSCLVKTSWLNEIKAMYTFFKQPATSPQNIFLATFSAESSSASINTKYQIFQKFKHSLSNFELWKPWKYK